MSVVESKSVIDWLNEYKLISDTYSIERLVNDLNQLFYSSEILKDITDYQDEQNDEETLSKIEDKIRDYFDRIKLLVTDDTRIKSKADLKTLTLSRIELERRYEAYRNADVSLHLPSIGLIAEDPKSLLMRIEYCRNFRIPYKDEDNILLKDIASVSESTSYLPRFWEVYFKAYNEANKEPDSKVVDEQLNGDRISKIYANMQWYSYNKYGRFIIISKALDDDLKTYLEKNPESTDDVKNAQICFLKSQADNPFVEEKTLEELQGMSLYNPTDDDFNHRNGRR